MTNSPKYNMRYIWAICLVAAFGGLLFGYDWVVIGGAKPFYEKYFHLTDSAQQGWAMSCALVGCLIGSVLSGALSDKFGRKRLLILAGALFTASAVGTGLADTMSSFVFYRILGGVGIGLASNLSPMYIAEVSPAEMRGRFVSINQLTIVIGILAAQIINWQIADPVPTADQIRLLLDEPSAARVMAGRKDFDLEAEVAAARRVADETGLAAVKEALPNIEFVRARTDEPKEAKAEEDSRIMAAYLLPTWNGQYGWRWMFAAETLPAAAFFLFMFLVPESPRWLVKNAKDEQARRILGRVGGAAYGDAAVADIRETLADEIERVNFRDLLEPKMRTILVLGVGLAVFQQWCGINVIFNYAEDVFAAAGYGVSEMLFQVVISGLVNLLFTFVAINTVDRWGRRVLMLAGAASLAVVYSLIGACFFLHSQGIHVVVLVMLAIACYACTLAPITWVVLSEIFPNRIRGAAMSVSVFALWTGCFTLTYTFPQLKDSIGPAGTFWLYSGICVLGFLFILARLPETKGKTLEQIERELVD